ncbi:MAG: MATE family efflux transporter [Lachnospiraceae bacterium]|nr:MATE family efflux transporter [Lachnospiraceae bacterium]
MVNLRTRKILKFVIPTMMSNVCFFLFTVIDGIFVGRGIGTNGLGAVNLVMPFTLITGALFMLVNIGGATIFAVRLGQNDTEGANRVFRNGMILLVCVAAVLTAAGTLGTDTICTLFGANETFHRLSRDYLFWYALFVIPSGLNMGLQSYCRNDDDPGLVGVATIISTAANIFGDWLLIFPLGMETKGAAIATGVSQTISMLVMLTHFIRKKGILRFGRTKLDGKLLRSIVVHGLPEGVGQLATPVMTLCMNLVLVSHIGDLGVNAFSLISYVASFTVAVFFGTSEGLQPLFGQSYGEKNETDMKFYFKVGLGINLIGSAVLTVIIILLSRNIFILFGSDAETIEYTLGVLPKYAWGFLLMAFNVMISAYMYSTERSVYAIILNVLRSLVVSVLIIMLLPEIFGANTVWYTFGIYEAIVLIFAILLLRHSERNGIQFDKA